jgi:hypothetical protein
MKRQPKHVVIASGVLGAMLAVGVACAVIYNQTYWTKATETDSFVVNTGRFTAPDGAYGYRWTVLNGGHDNEVSNWGQLTQIYAYAEMRRHSAAYNTALVKSYQFMDEFLVPTSCSGSAQTWGLEACTGVNGAACGDGTQYSDENALAGLVFLTAYDTTGDPDYLEAAEARAAWLCRDHGRQQPTRLLPQQDDEQDAPRVA